MRILFGQVFASALICFLVLPAQIYSRQVCWTCQYVKNGAGKEQCATSPGNWTFGDPRIKCESKCIISAEFDAVTGNITFLYRGCAESTQKDGCTDSGSSRQCFYSCWGTHYCNDKVILRSSKQLDDSGAAGLMRSRELLKFVFVVIICGLLVTLM